MRRNHAFTMVEAAVLIAMGGLLMMAIVVMVTKLGSPHRGLRRQYPNNTHIRGIHMATVMYAQGNNGYFPGLDRDGNDLALPVEDRLFILLDNNYFTGEYAISPSETKTAWTTGPVTTAHYSYAMLQLPAPGSSARRFEWRETLNTEAPVMGDRAIVTKGQQHSVHTNPGDGWRGGVAYNDNHVVFESTTILATRYGPSASSPVPGAPGARGVTPQPGVSHPADDLFVAAGDDDAWFVHSGNPR